MELFVSDNGIGGDPTDPLNGFGMQVLTALIPSPEKLGLFIAKQKGKYF